MSRVEPRRCRRVLADLVAEAARDALVVVATNDPLEAAWAPSGLVLAG
jgi:hypothetical protein